MRDLLNEILRGKFWNADGITRTKFDVIDALQRAVAIDATNVHEWKLTNKHCWVDRLPHLPPRIPFPCIWVEWIEMEPDSRGHLNPIPFGLLVEELENHLTGEDGAVFRRVGPDSTEDDMCYSQIITVFAKPNAKALAVAELQDEPRELGDYIFTRNVRDSQRIGGYVGESIPVRFPKSKLAQALNLNDDLINEWASVRALETYLPMLIFMNCRNVTLNPVHRPNKVQRKFQSRYKVRRPSFHVIEVHKSMVRNVYEQGIASESVTHAHMVRGHVKRYGEHNKLFGRIAGSWFWQSHVRGDIGTPSVSDYRVWGATPIHSRKCDIN